MAIVVVALIKLKCVAATATDQGIVAPSAKKGVLSGSAIQHVLSEVPADFVVEFVPGSVDSRAALQPQDLDIGCQGGDADRGEDRVVGSSIDLFDYQVVHTVHSVKVARVLSGHG